jgi:hypothetical protein
MTLLRRPEVCVLLAIVIAGLIWVVVDQRSRDRETSAASVGGRAAGVRDFAISRADMAVDGSHRRLRLEFTARHEGSAPLEVRSPVVRLLDAAGHEVPAFLSPAPFLPHCRPDRWRPRGWNSG